MFLDQDLKDRVFLLTGGGAGIGEAINRSLLTEGGSSEWSLAGCHNILMRFASEVKVNESRCAFFEAQLADPEQCRLTAPYQPTLESAYRKFELRRDRKSSVWILDSLSGGAGHVLRWNLHTDAVVSLDGAVAILAKNGKRLRITIEAPTASEFKVIAAAAPPPQAQQPTVHTLIFDTALSKGPTLLRVLFDPL